MQQPLDLHKTLTLILAGGQGKRLEPLTLRRAKPAVPFGGVYRIIDFTLSNCIHSGLRSIYLLTQYQARSLEEHIRFGWNFLPRRLNQFISVRPPHHQGTEKWYSGTADAIYQNLDTIASENPERVLILSGDHIYQMDYRHMIREHVENGAALTIGAVKIPVDQAYHFGIFEVDEDGRVKSFQEKPKTGAAEIPGQPGWCLGSMGIYVFETGELVGRLRDDAEAANSSHDFGKDIIPAMIEDSPVYAHHFVDVSGRSEPYWRDVGTLDAYYEANMDLVGVQPQLNLYDPEWPTYALWHNDPPAKVIFAGSDRETARTQDCLLANGAVLAGGRTERSILAPQTYVAEETVIEDSILFSGVQVGRGAKIRRAIVEKWTEIPPGAEIGYDLDADRERFTVTESGIVVVPAGAEIEEPVPA